MLDFEKVADFVVRGIEITKAIKEKVAREDEGAQARLLLDGLEGVPGDCARARVEAFAAQFPTTPSRKARKYTKASS